MAIFTITRIIEKFPPCWLAANQEYRTFLKEKGKHLITGAGAFTYFIFQSAHHTITFTIFHFVENFSANHTLFEDLINGVESAIQAPVKRTAKKHDDVPANNSLFNDSLLNESQDLQCFSKWELKHTQKYSVSAELLQTILYPIQQFYKPFVFLSHPFSLTRCHVTRKFIEFSLRCRCMWYFLKLIWRRGRCGNYLNSTQMNIFVITINFVYILEILKSRAIAFLTVKRVRWLDAFCGQIMSQIKSTIPSKTFWNCSWTMSALISPTTKHTCSV